MVSPDTVYTIFFILMGLMSLGLLYLAWRFHRGK